jgi:hypothetical protein
MNDLEMYATGWMNPDEQEQWDHVTQMMATSPPHRGSDCQWEDTGDDCEDEPEDYDDIRDVNRDNDPQNDY